MRNPTQISLRKQYNILAYKTYMSMNSRKTYRNNNICAFDGTEQEREGLILANLLQANSSYVVYDPAGTLYRKAEGLLRREGYTVRMLDFTVPERSTACYNPFRYAPDVHTQDMARTALLEAGISSCEQLNLPKDEMDLHRLVYRKMAVFCCNFSQTPNAPLLVSLLIHQALRTAFSAYPGAIVHTRFLALDCIDSAILHSFAEHASFLCSKNLSYIVSLPSFSRLHETVGNHAEFLYGYADEHVFFSSPGLFSHQDTEPYLLERFMDKERNMLRALKRGYCAVFIRGIDPMLTRPYKPTDHPAMRVKS